MDKVRLLKVLSRHKKEELFEVFDKLGLGDERLKRGRTKKELVSILVDKCVENNLSEVQLLQLELEYVVAHCNSLTWKAYRLERSDVRADITHVDLSKRLQLYLSDVFNYEMTDVVKSSGHWLCLRIEDERQTPYTCFIFHSPPAPFVFVSGIKKDHLALVLEAVSLALDSHGCTDLELSGRNLDSLVELVIHQHSQGPYSAYRLNEVDPNPLQAVAKRRCRRVLDVESEEDQRRKAASDAFGNNPLPVLEKFTFKLLGNVDNLTEPIQCKVKLTGSNVLEGIKQCVVMGSVTLPVPQTLTCMPGLATNTVTLETDSQDSYSDTGQN